MLLIVPGVAAKGRIFVLGKDVKGDAPAGLDLSYVGVGRWGDGLGILIGVEGMSRLTGGYDALQRVSWAFDADDRSFRVDAYMQATQQRFVLHERVGSTYRQLEGVRGHYNFDGQFIGILIPFRLLGAKKGTEISGAAAWEGEDAISRIHAAERYSRVFDVLATKKTFVIP